MDEDEIDGKYEEEKENLLDEYIARLEQGMDKDKTAQWYHKRFEAIQKKFNTQMNKALYRKNHPPLHKKILASLQKPKPKQ